MVHKWGMRQNWKNISFGLIVLLGGFFAVSNLWLSSAGLGRAFIDADKVPDGSVMVLLGIDDKVYRDGKVVPSELYWNRIHAAVTLAKTGRVKLIIASGAPGQPNKMAAQLKSEGVTCPILCDDFGVRTLDSVRRTATIYSHEKIVFVSQDWHCDRALWMADRAGVKACSYPADFGSGTDAYYGWMRDWLAKPKAVIDWVAGSRLSTSQPIGTGLITFTR